MNRSKSQSTRAFSYRTNGSAASGMTITDLHARGLVRAYLEQERERAKEVGRRRMRIRIGVPSSLRAANNELTQLDKAWSPLAIATYRETTDAGAARLGVLRLQTDHDALEPWPGIVARSASRQYTLHPGDMLYTREPAGACAFTQHSLERVMQRAGTGAIATQEIRAAAIVANSLLHAQAVEQGYKRMLVPAHSGVFVGDFSPDLPFIRFDTFLRIEAAGRRHCDLLSELAGLLWTRDGYQKLLPATLYPEEACALMDEVLAVYARHGDLLSRTHRPGEDWFELARRQGRPRQLAPQHSMHFTPALSGDVLERWS
jgi:hypothetical protein